jgi:signal transduction histidine kinase
MRAPPARVWPRSLTWRLAASAAFWVAIGLGLIGWFVVRTDARQIEAAADARIERQLDYVVAAVAFDRMQGPMLLRPLSDPEFERPLSGFYWQLTGPGGTVLTSRSLWDSRLAPPLVSEGGLTARDMLGPRGEALRALEREVTIEAPGGRAAISVQVAVSRAEVDAEILTLRRGVVLAFVLLGAGLVAVVVVLVVWGLRPLRRTQEELVEVREGRRQHMDVAAPSEIAPLVDEIEALIEQNRATVERARHHVGNLAHALKTPIAVLRNAIESGDPAAAKAQTVTLERLVQHHLRRARAGALAGSAAGECSPHEVAGAVATALGRLTAQRGLSILVTGDRAARVRADSQDLTEMLGNLIENATKFARARVRVTISAPRGQAVAIEIEDDGPGLPPGEDTAALARGVRLDESKAGSGLGLAIVNDLAQLYGGQLQLLGGGALGGLRARLELPGVWG